MIVNLDPHAAWESNDRSTAGHVCQAVTTAVLESVSSALREHGALFAYVHESVAKETASSDSDLDVAAFLHRPSTSKFHGETSRKC